MLVNDHCIITYNQNSVYFINVFNDRQNRYLCTDLKVERVQLASKDTIIVSTDKALFEVDLSGHKKKKELLKTRVNWFKIFDDLLLVAIKNKVFLLHKASSRILMQHKFNENIIDGEILSKSVVLIDKNHRLYLIDFGNKSLQTFTIDKFNNFKNIERHNHLIVVTTKNAVLVCDLNLKTLQEFKSDQYGLHSYSVNLEEK